MRTGVLPREEEYAKWVSRVGSKCFIDERQDLVCYKLTKKNMRPRTPIFAPSAIRDKLVQDAHVSDVNGHSAAFKTLNRIQEAFWWPAMSEQVDKVIRSCLKCEVASGRKPKPAPLQSLPICYGPGERVHGDLFGPLFTTDTGKKYIAVFTDAFSKYVELAAIPDKSATTVATAFLEKWVLRHSVPHEFVTDQGKEFTANVLKDLASMLEMKHIRTSPYHAMSNSGAESYNRVIIKYMRKMLLDQPSTRDWEPLLPALMFCYNTQVHKSTMETPFFLTFLHDPRFPFFELETRQSYGEDFVAEKMNELRHAFTLCRENMRTAASKSKEYYDKKAVSRQFEIGDEVLLYFPALEKSQANRKFVPVWKSGFKILRRIGNLNLEVTPLSKNKPFVVHVNRVKLRGDQPSAEPEEPQSGEEGRYNFRPRKKT